MKEGTPVHLVRKAYATFALVLAGIALTGCSVFESGPGPTDSETVTETAAPEVTFVPGGGAEENKAFFDKTLQDLLDSNPDAGSRDLVTTLANAGFDKGQMEVTFDKTSVDLDADFVIVSVKMPDDMCLIGQTGTRGYASMIAEPMKSTGKCQIGVTQDITW